MINKKLLVTEPFKVVVTEDEFDDSNLSVNDIVIKSVYTHLSAGTELACLAGIEGWFQIPDTPGYTAIAEVVKTGENITHVKPGDLVYTYGPHAQFYKLEYGERWHGICVKVPQGVNPEHAAFTHMAGIAMTSLRNSTIELGDVVLVTGLGAIGNLAAQLAQLQGADVIATDIDENRIERAKQAGIAHVLNPTKVDVEKEIRAITGGGLVNTYIDATGATPVINQSLDLIAENGEVILLGSPRAPYESNLTETLQHFHLPPNLTLKGALEFTLPTHNNDFNKHSIERNASILMKLIKEGKLKIDPIYSHKMKPEDAQKAYDGLKNKPQEYIGVVFDWNN